MATAQVRTKEEIARDIDRTRSVIRASVGNTKQYLTRENAAVRAWKKTRKTYGKVKDSIVDGAQTVAERARQTDTCIRDNPYHSVGIALLAGVAVGWLFTHRRQK